MVPRLRLASCVHVCAQAADRMLPDAQNLWTAVDSLRLSLTPVRPEWLEGNPCS